MCTCKRTVKDTNRKREKRNRSTEEEPQKDVMRGTSGGEGLIVSLGQHRVIRRGSSVSLQHWVSEEMVPQSS